MRLWCKRRCASHRKEALPKVVLLREWNAKDHAVMVAHAARAVVCCCNRSKVNGTLHVLYFGCLLLMAICMCLFLVIYLSFIQTRWAWAACAYLRFEHSPCCFGNLAKTLAHCIWITDVPVTRGRITWAVFQIYSVSLQSKGFAFWHLKGYSRSALFYLCYQRISAAGVTRTRSTEIWKTANIM